MNLVGSVLEIVRWEELISIDTLFLVVSIPQMSGTPKIPISFRVPQYDWRMRLGAEATNKNVTHFASPPAVSNKSPN